MAELRLPEPMTPERAQQVANRWRLASFAVLAVFVPLMVVGVPYALNVGVLLLLPCLVRESRHLGWLNGYRVARTEDLRRDAGELL